MGQGPRGRKGAGGARVHTRPSESGLGGCGGSGGQPCREGRVEGAADGGGGVGTRLGAGVGEPGGTPLGQAGGGPDPDGVDPVP